MMTNENRQIVIKKLHEKIGHYICPVCHNSSFTIADGFLANTLQDDLTSMQLGGPFLPSVALVCNKCGFTSLHNIKVLGIDDNS